jgi:nucleotide-binding universal stress UspA family protein
VYQHLLIPTDGSPLSSEAITHGIMFAKDAGAKITFLTVREPFHVFSVDLEQVEDTRDEYQAHMQQRASRYLAGAAELANAAGVPCDVIQVEDTHPYRAIIHVADSSHCDLIMMASHGRRGISALVLGSETVKVLTHSAIPVLVYRLPRNHPANRQRAGDRSEPATKPTELVKEEQQRRPEAIAH